MSKKSQSKQGNNPNSVPSEETMKEDADQAKQDLSLENTQPSENEEESTINLEALREQYRIFEQAKKQYEEQQKALTKETKDYQQQKERLTQKEAKLNEQAETLKVRENQIQDLSNQLREKERSLEQQEINAKTGFIQEREEIFASLEQQKTALQEQLNDYYKQVTQEEEKQFKEREQRRREIETQLQEERLKLEAEREQLEQEKRELRRQQNQLKSEQELLQEDQDALEEKVEQRVATQIRELEGKLHYREEQLQQERSISHNLESRLAEKKNTERQFGHKTPEEILEELERLREINAELEQQLAQRPSMEKLERLQQLEEQREAWENERFNLRTKIQELERSNSSYKISVTQLENLREEKETLEVRNRYLKQNLDELKAEVGQTIEEAKEQTPFPLCFNMDENRSLQGNVPLTDRISNLEQFTQELRDRIALSPSTKGKYLYYSLREIRLFLAGLAMSRLHLLQGISGTGKTSLAVGFAKAVQGGQKLVEVQAGWRDKQDLIGYFNAFEKRFYESDFLQALYEAQCPAYEDKIYIIVLDEMNLSRPEQYFADFLSKLEQENPTLKLDTDLNRPAPRLFINGNELKVPDNVWFIGTANQDETTLEFADKTYDRAHIMDLERRHQPFNLPDQLDPEYPIS